MKATILLLLVSLTALAGFRGYNGTTDLDIFAELKCSTGLSCSKTGDQFVMIVDPAIVGASAALTGAEAGNATVTLAADESDDNGDDWVIQSTASDNDLDITNDVSGSQVVKFSIATDGDVSMVGDLLGDGGDFVTGFLKQSVAATATTILSTQCGSTFVSGGAVQIELPEASTVIGCRLTFAVGNASNFDINPDNGDQILTETDAAGDAIRSAVLGETITIEAISASQWVVIAVNGTWADIN